MLSIHHLDERGLQRASVDPAIFFVASKLDPSLLWVDLLEPTAEEEALIEEQFHVAVPTREEMREIETSNRLYEEDGVLFLTATVVTQLDTDHPQNNPITFILTRDVLITNRYVVPLPFQR